MTAQAAERKALSEGLAKLNENMITMAEMSVLAIRTASAGLVTPREAQAEAVFTLDQEIYGMREEVVKGCVDLIALHAPVARDLRTITMSLETTTDLDRIGRYARDIAEVSQRLGRDGGPKSRLDELHKEYIQAIFECHHESAVDLEAGVQLALIGRYYERVGDHAVNIGERVRYMVTGWLPEHTGAARAAARKPPPEGLPGPD